MDDLKPRIPLELQWKVLDHLGEDKFLTEGRWDLHYRVMRSCSLTCKTWAVHCQPMVCRHMVIRDFEELESRRLEFEAHPERRGLVETLRISVQHDEHRRPLHELVLIVLLPWLRNVHSLHFFGELKSESGFLDLSNIRVLQCASWYASNVKTLCISNVVFWSLQAFRKFVLLFPNVSTLNLVLVRAHTDFLPESQARSSIKRQFQCHLGSCKVQVHSICRQLRGFLSSPTDFQVQPRISENGLGMPLGDPWRIYQEQLFRVRYGLPLWHPEPNQPHGTQKVAVPVKMGAVGFMREGRFVALFNAMKSYTDPDNQGGVPANFEPFLIDKTMRVDSPKSISDSVFLSKNLRHVFKNTRVDATSRGLGFEYEVGNGPNAFLAVKPCGKSERIHSDRPVKEYALHNIQDWKAFANDLDGAWRLGLEEHDLMFVTGTVTARQWLLSTMDYKAQQGDILTIPSRVYPASFSMYSRTRKYHLDASGFREYDQPTPIAEFLLGRKTFNFLRREREIKDEEGQVLFIHYWKMKFEGSRVNMRAAAGPHQLPDDPDDSNVDPGVPASGAESSHSHTAEVPAKNEVTRYDPVDYLLDFILQHPDARVAIACDTHLELCFADGDIPYNIPASLQELDVKRFVGVDENGVGIILDREEQERVKKHEEAKVASENARKASETRTLPPRFAEVWNKCSPAAFVEPANGPSVLPILSY